MTGQRTPGIKTRDFSAPPFSIPGGLSLVSKRPLRMKMRILTTLVIFTVTLPATGAVAQEKLLHSFKNNSKDGHSPYAGLIFDASGNLYGTTELGGAYGYGTVFELTPKAGGGWTETVLHNFGNGADGAILYSGLIADASGNLYGTTYFGGAYFYGTVFELTPANGGNWTEKILHSFDPNGTDGYSPVAGLIADAAGNLYSTTQHGGAYGAGTVYELTPNAGGSWEEKILHNFSNNGTDGYEPFAGLIFDAAGNLYGTTYYGGAYGVSGNYTGGTVFELTPAAGGIWTETVLHNFNDNGTDGNNPEADLIFDATGNLYGTTFEGGVYGYGTVFELTPAEGGIWTETERHSFGNGADGEHPTGGVIIDAAGNLYGSTTFGGPFGYGTVFELTPQGGEGRTEKILHSFNSTDTDGAEPTAGLIFDAAGNLYGTTTGGGVHHSGTVFEITSSTATALRSNLNPSIYGQKVIWTATVTTSGSVTPTGKVNFTWDGYSIGRATLNASGVATLTKSNLNADSYPLTAVYKGDANNAGSTSFVLNQVVNETTSAATLSSSANPSTEGQAVTFNATITSPTVTPTGPVTFTAGTTVLGTVQLSGHKATFTTSTLPVGSTTVTATYNGDSNIAGSSASVTQTVEP
jgi:uncharacterized repeat protein (TIGR03803 family)